MNIRGEKERKIGAEAHWGQVSLQSVKHQEKQRNIENGGAWSGKKKVKRTKTQGHRVGSST